MDGISENNVQQQPKSGQTLKIITIIAATNRPWDLDEAFRRRLEKRIRNFWILDIPLPNA